MGLGLGRGAPVPGSPEIGLMRWAHRFMRWLGHRAFLELVFTFLSYTVIRGFYSCKASLVKRKKILAAWQNLTGATSPPPRTAAVLLSDDINAWPTDTRPPDAHKTAHQKGKPPDKTKQTKKSETLDKPVQPLSLAPLLAAAAAPAPLTLLMVLRCFGTRASSCEKSSARW